MARVSIEDCLDYIENRFALVAVASDRTRILMDGEESLVRSKNKEAVTALREIAEGLIVAKPVAPISKGILGTENAANSDSPGAAVLPINGAATPTA